MDLPVKVCTAVGSDKERSLTVFLCLIRSTKIAALVADVWTFAYAALLLGWQTFIFLSEGVWPGVSLQVALGKLGYGHGVVYETAATRGIGAHDPPSALHALLQVPAIVPSILVAVFITAFYLWLSRIEKQYSENNGNYRLCCLPAP